MRSVCIVAVVVGTAFAAGTVIRGQAAKTPPAKGTIVAASDLKWIDNPSFKGAQQAILWGDPAKGAYGVLKKVPGGTVLPMHWHTATTRVVDIAGTIAFNFEGSPAKDLGPQSYVSVPGGAKHGATCKAGADCVYFETSTAAYDMKTGDAK